MKNKTFVINLPICRDPMSGRPNNRDRRLVKQLMGLSLKPWIGISFGLRDLTIVHLAKLHATFSVLLRKDNSTTLTRFYNYVFKKVRSAFLLAMVLRLVCANLSRAYVALQMRRDRLLDLVLHSI